MSMRSMTLPIVCDGAGAATVYSDRPVVGEILAIRFTIGTLAAGATDLTFTDDATGAAILTVTNAAGSADYYPRGAAVNPSNVAITNSFVPIVATGKIKLVVAQGGAAGAGSFTLWWRD